MMKAQSWLGSRLKKLACKNLRN